MSLKWCVCLMVLVVSSCNPREDASGSSQTREDETATQTSGASSWQAETDGGERVVELDIGDVVTVRFGGTTLVGKNKSGKRKYEKDGAVVIDIKAEEDKVKLKDPSGKLLWKLKITPDKVKISDNEEGENPYEIKTKEDGFKVVRGEVELGKVKHVDGRIKVKDGSDKAMFRGSGARASAAWGVLLLVEIPEAERFVIMAELASRGR